MGKSTGGEGKGVTKTIRTPEEEAADRLAARARKKAQPRRAHNPADDRRRGVGSMQAIAKADYDARQKAKAVRDAHIAQSLKAAQFVLAREGKRPVSFMSADGILKETIERFYELYVDATRDQVSKRGPLSVTNGLAQYDAKMKALQAAQPGAYRLGLRYAGDSLVWASKELSKTASAV